MAKALFARAFDLVFLSSPYGIRTRAATLRGWCPRPLDERAELRGPTLPARRYVTPARPVVGEQGIEPLNNRTRICCVACYTTPHRSERRVYRRHRVDNREPPERPTQPVRSLSRSKPMIRPTRHARGLVQLARGTTASRSRRWSASATRTASSPNSSAISRLRSEWYGSVTSTTPIEPALVEHCGGGRERLVRGGARVLAHDRRLRHAPVDQVLGRCLRLGEPVARLVAAGDHRRSAPRLVRTARRRGRVGPPAAATAARRTARRRAPRSRRPAAPDRLRAGAHTCSQRDQVVHDDSSATSKPAHVAATSAATRHGRRPRTTGVGPAGRAVRSAIAASAGGPTVIVRS